MTLQDVYYLSIFATVESADGEVAHRIFGLDLKAGDESEIASQARRSSKTDRVEETPSGELLRVWSSPCHSVSLTWSFRALVAESGERAPGMAFI